MDTVKAQQAIMLRDTGRALLVIAVNAVEIHVPDLPDIQAMQSFLDDIFVAGYLDNHRQQHISTMSLREELRTLIEALTAAHTSDKPNDWQALSHAARELAKLNYDDRTCRLAMGVANTIEEFSRQQC